MTSIDKLVREEIYSLPTYVRENEIENSIDLHRNENPWSDFTFGDVQLNRYPESQPSLLRQQLANILKVLPENIVITRGSDEAIDILIRLFCAPYRHNIMVFPPTFKMYEITAKMQAVGVIEVPLLPNYFAIDIDSIAMNMAFVKIIFICSPNNPTGSIVDVKLILDICQQYRESAIVVVDEAYVDFASSPSCIHSLRDHENLVVLRTLSKAYGLAAIRCGMAIAHPLIVQLMQKIMSPYPISLLSSVAASTSLAAKNLAAIQQRIQIIKSERERLIAKINEFAWVDKVWPSQANFFLVKLKEVNGFIHYCQQKNILVRNVSKEMYLNNCIRISVGTPVQNNYLLKILSEYQS